jgi:hypothetical protein
MHIRLTTAAVLAGLIAAPAGDAAQRAVRASTPAGGAAQPAGPLTATGIRIGDHPGRVRVVVDFRGGRVLEGQVVASDPRPFRDGRVRLPLMRPGVSTTAAPARAHGVSASVAQGSRRIVIRLDAAPRRFKYVAYRALHSPERLAIDVYDSRPPSPAAEIRRAPDGCLSLDDFAIGPRRVTASGRERNLFEHSLVVRLRRANGVVHRERAATAAARRWSTTFRYPRTRRRTGTLEAVALSAKDGTLDCLTQVRVRFGGG